MITAFEFEDVAVFYLAGGFGRHLKTSASKRIGLIPDISDDKIVQVGNAALEGATIALVSRARRERAGIAGEEGRSIGGSRAIRTSSISLSTGVSSGRQDPELR